MFVTNSKCVETKSQANRPQQPPSSVSGQPSIRVASIISQWAAFDQSAASVISQWSAFDQLTTFVSPSSVWAFDSHGLHELVDFTYYWFLATSISHRPSTVSKLCQLLAFISQLVSISNRPSAVTKPLSRLTLTLSLIFVGCVIQSLSQVFIICINTMLLCITFVGNWLLIYSILVTSIPVQVLKWQPSQAIWTITLSYNAELIFYSNFTIIFAGCIITLHLLNIFAQMLSFSSSHTYIA